MRGSDGIWSTWLAHATRLPLTEVSSELIVTICSQLDDSRKDRHTIHLFSHLALSHLALRSAKSLRPKSFSPPVTLSASHPQPLPLSTSACNQTRISPPWFRPSRLRDLLLGATQSSSLHINLTPLSIFFFHHTILHRLSLHHTTLHLTKLHNFPSNNRSCKPDLSLLEYTSLQHGRSTA